MLLSKEILTLEGPSSLLRVRFEPIKTDIVSMCGHGTCVNIVVYAFARFCYRLFALFGDVLFERFFCSGFGGPKK